ncbi:hypothetical protein [Deinococcus roseus]|uniref:PEGA domain-containing protein n=1 Tax=Deinococcus roseus TaxID=392414 RepID=A0ABQ2D9V3_9DEIO|nr:hypothetical protein [Deinococcus roseus]GGJ51035.1 hypothetical protein GCM10008938_41300 [Deinococcus roseus]
MRYGWLLGATLLVLGMGSSLALEGLFTLKVKNFCENSMDVFIDGEHVGKVEQEAEFLMVPGSHLLYAKNDYQYTSADLMADQDYDWTLCE